MDNVHDAIGSYYRTNAVRARVEQYCASALRIAGFGGRGRLSGEEGSPWAGPDLLLGTLLEDGADVCRSLADTEGVLLHLDVDYVNPAWPDEPLLHPEPCFEAMEPTYWAALDAFARHGIRPLT